MKKVQKTDKKFSSLRPLVLMQIKDQLDFSVFKSFKKFLFKAIFSLLTFVALTAGIYLIFYLVVNFGLFSFLKILNFRAYLVLMTVVFLLSFISCLIKVTNSLYFSKDNPVLITLPTSTNTIFSSKLIVSFIYELAKNVNYILPFFVAYGIIMHMPIAYYFYSLFSLLVWTLLSVSLSGFLSIFAMWVLIAFKRIRALEFLVVMLVGLGAVYLFIKGISLIPNDIDLVRDWGKIYWSLQTFLAEFSKNMFAFELLLNLFSGMVYNGFSFNPLTKANALAMLVVALIIALSLALIYLLSRPLFLKMISSPFEFKKNEKLRKNKNTKLPAFLSSIWQETLVLIRTPKILYTVLAVAILAPVAVFIQNKLIAVMDTKLLGNFMGLAFNILIIMLLSLSSNAILASINSKDGASVFISRSNPISPVKLITAKIFPIVLVNLISITASVIVIDMFNSMGIKNAIMLELILILVYVGHALWSVQLDIVNPQTKIYQTSGGTQNNPNENKSSIIAFIISAVLSFITFFLMSEDQRSVYFKILILAIVFALSRIVLFVKNVSLYYKED